MNTGARLRNFHLANAVGTRASVTFLQILQPGEAVVTPPPNNFERVLSVEKSRSYTYGKVLRGMVGPLPVTVLNYTAASVEGYLKGILQTGNFDLIQLESIHLISYLKTIRSMASRTKILLDWHNIESELMERYARSTKNPAKRIVANRTANLLAKVELEALSNCDAHTVVSEREKEKLISHCPSASIKVIPNGVDTAFFQGETQNRERNSLLFVGSMDYHANEEAVLWFFHEVWPKLSADMPRLHFVIAGRNPSAAAKAISCERVIVTGTVDDVRPCYETAAAVIVPLRVGGGTRLKILEAMAAGVPVIATRLGAEGLDVRDGKDILLADSSLDIQNAVQQVVSDKELRISLAEAGRELVRSKYDWAELGNKLAALYSEICGH
jgi:glycosyltransferase involved in cell wall biosynthesis